ncbi:MAG: hypothetical protein SFX73_25700 [Kofleriaceae bacterium]|nr:hypothetical protein [Kofleriaceae bacterium]
MKLSLLVSSLVLCVGCGGKSAGAVEPAPGPATNCPDVGAHVGAALIAAVDAMAVNDPNLVPKPPTVEQKEQARGKLAAAVTDACVASWKSDAAACVLRATMDDIEGCYVYLDEPGRQQLATMIKEAVTNLVTPTTP